jgi:8-oxo-dGTP diphosphatase
LEVLLVERKAVRSGEPSISLPGDDVLANEHMLDAANRVLKQQTGLEIPLYRFRSFEDPDRLNRPIDEGNRVITKAYLGFVGDNRLSFGGLAIDGGFRTLDKVPAKLLYDHRKILNAAISALIKAAENHLLPLDGMPDSFTITHVQQFYESVLNRELDKRNFRRVLLSKNYLTETGEMLTGQNFRPAKLYHFDQFKYQHCLDKELEKLPVVLF